MTKYIDTKKLIKSVNNYQEGAKAALNPTDGDADYYKGKIDACKDIQEFIESLQQEQQEVDLEKTKGGTDYLDKDKMREWDELSLKNRIYNEANSPGPTGGKEIRG